MKTLALEAEETAKDFLCLVPIKNETMEVQYFNKFKLSNKFTTLPWTDKTKRDGSNLSYSRLMFSMIGNKIIPANRWKLCHATHLWNIRQWYHKDSELLTTYFGFLFHRIISQQILRDARTVEFQSCKASQTWLRLNAKIQER